MRQSFDRPHQIPTTLTRQIQDRFRTVSILVMWVAPLSLQAGPVAGEAVAKRHVNRLLDEQPSDQDELPQELELQCYLISLVSDAVTLRAIDSDKDSNGGAATAPLVQLDSASFPEIGERLVDRGPIVSTVRKVSDEQPQGP